MDLFCQEGKHCYFKDIWATVILKVRNLSDRHRHWLLGWALQGL